jgi:hypothetical protein
MNTYNIGAGQICYSCKQPIYGDIVIDHSKTYHLTCYEKDMPVQVEAHNFV